MEIGELVPTLELLTSPLRPGATCAEVEFATGGLVNMLRPSTCFKAYVPVG